MSRTEPTESTHRFAVVGAGPAGIYASQLLLRKHPQARVDLYEKLPAPYGLVRYGVAPDHPRIQRITTALHRILEDPRIRLVCNVELGERVTIEQLREAYAAVIIATGADLDVGLDIPGVELPGSFGAADFVAWYDGHPDAPREWPLNAESIAVLGAGNVALDVARMLVKHARTLAETDVATHVEEALEANPVRDVHIFARRGPADVRFTPLELRELGEQEDVDVVVDPRDMELDDHASRMVRQFTPVRQVVEEMTKWSQIDPASRTASRRVHLHFYQQPARIVGEESVTGIEMERTAPDPLGRVAGTGEYITHDVQAVYRAIGYRSTPVPGLPFDDTLGRIPERESRVLAADGSPIPGVYVTGWVRRGPVGLIGSTRPDAKETVETVAADVESGHLPAASDEAYAALVDALPDAIDWEAWLRIDAAEQALGQGRGRERTKIADRAEMLREAGRG